MGENTYSKPKLGRSISRAKKTSNKILSVLLAIIMITTVFSSIIVADDDSSTDTVTVHGSKIGSKIKEFINRIRENRKGMLSLGLVTRYQKDGSDKIMEASTRMRLLLPTAIDIDGDGDNDIRVWVIRRPALDLSPPALAWKTTILVRRLPGMDKDDKDMTKDFFEIYLEYNSRALSGLGRLLSKDKSVVRIRLGYQSPAGEEIPKYCIISHKDIPHLIYARKKNAHRVSINPGLIKNKDQLNLLFSIADVKDGVELSKLDLQINHDPAVKNEFSIEREKDYFIRRGQTLEISRKTNVKSNVSLLVKDMGKLDRGSLTIEDIPEKITLGWKLARTGYVNINTGGSLTGFVKAKVDGTIDLGFRPEKGLNAGLNWSLERPGILGRLKGEGFKLGIGAVSSLKLYDFYAYAYNLPRLPNYETLNFTASLLSLAVESAGASLTIKNPLRKTRDIDNFEIELNNAELILENGVMDIVTPDPIEKPTVSIESPGDGETVDGTTTISGTASAPDGRNIEFVEIVISDSDERILASGTHSWSYDWNTNALPNGEYTIDAQSFDGLHWSSLDTHTVIVNNGGNNWYPLISIETPQNGDVVSGVAQVKGKASDPFGSITKVEIQINNGDWIEADSYDSTTGKWSYEWDTKPLVAGGEYTIKARSYDSDGVYSSVTSVKVSIKSPPTPSPIERLTITSKDSSINVTSLVINKDGVTQLQVENLSGRLSREVKLAFFQDEIGIEVNSSVFLKFDSFYIVGVPTIGPFILEGDGLISAGINIIDENIVIGGYGDGEEVTIEAKDLKIGISGAEGKYLEIDADQIIVKGKGNLSASENHKEIKGTLAEFTVDNLCIKSDLGSLALSGSIDSLQDGEIIIEGDKSNFSILYNGEKDLVISYPKLTLRTESGTVIASADSVTTTRSGHASFNYEKDEEENTATCEVIWSEICFDGLIVSYDDLSSSLGDLICGEGRIKFELSSIVYYELGDGWINITIGADGMAHLIADVYLYNGSDEIGYIDVDITVDNEGHLFIINVSWINRDATYIDGASSTEIEVFDLFIKDRIHTSIGRFTGSFEIHGEDGNLTLTTKHSISGSNIHFSRYLVLQDPIGFFSINITSIETSGGMTLHKSGKYINITSTDEEDVKIVHLKGLYVRNLIPSDAATIIEELSLVLTGMNTTVSVYLGEDETKIEAILTPDTRITIDTLWMRPFLMPTIDFRIHSLVITASTTIIVNNEDKSKLLTFDCDGKLTAKAIILNNIFYLYGVSLETSNDFSLSIGVPDSGGISFDISASVNIHLDTILIPGKKPCHWKEFRIDASGKGTIDINDHLLDIFTVGAGDVSIGGSIEEQFALSFKPSGKLFEAMEKYLPILTKKIRGYNFAIEADPGEFYIIFSDIFDLNPQDLPYNNGLFVYFESYGRFYLHNPNSLINPYIPLYEGRGFYESTVGYNEEFSFKRNPLDMDFIFDLTTNGDHCIRDKLNMSGDRDGLVNVSVAGQNILDSCGTIKIDWNGTKYWTIPEKIRFASDKEAHINWSFGLDEDTGTGVFETTEATVTVNYAQYPGQSQNEITTVTITNNLQEVVAVVNINLQGEVVSVNGGSNPLNNQPQNPENGENLPQDPEYVQELLNDVDMVNFWFWIWNPFNDSWFKLWPLPLGGDDPGPTLGPSVSLIGRKAGGVTSYVNYPSEIRPGDYVNFNAWYKPMDDGVNISGPFEFTFDFGDGSSYTAFVNATNDPINIHSDHVYTTLGTYEVTVTVTDTIHSDEIVTDTMRIEIIEDFFHVSGGLDWNYYDVDEEGYLTGSITIKNIANKTYSSDVTFNWSLINKTSIWGENWTIEPTTGTVGPEESDTVYVKFTPPESPGNYGFNESGNNDQQYIAVIKDGDLINYSYISLKLSYGVLDVIHDSKINFYIEEGETRTESLFWVFCKHWESLEETLEWEISGISFNFDENLIDYQFSMTSGNIYPWSPPSAVNLTLNASNPNFEGGEIQITLQRVNDPADSHTFNITVITLDPGTLDHWISPDNHEDTDWKREPDAYDDMPNISWSVYKKLGANHWSDVLTLTFDTSVSISGYNIKARKSIQLDKMNISFFNNGNPDPVYAETHGSWPKYKFKKVDFGDNEYDIDRVEIKFHEKGLAGFNVHRAFVYDFYVNEVI